MSLLQPSDFTGVFAQSKNEFTNTRIQEYLDRFEEIYLTDLLGCDMYTDFIADLTPTPPVTTSVPTDAKFTVIFDKFCIDDGDCQHVSEGMKAMLKFFIYFEYARDNQYTMAITGATQNNFSNAELIRLNQTRAIDNYNLGVNTYQEIQWYICDNPLDYDYDNYNGIAKEIIGWL